LSNATLTGPPATPIAVDARQPPFDNVTTSAQSAASGRVAARIAGTGAA
jgi:hypothetical protein